jgi:DNA-binding NarL/FixJ family response regulator
VVATVTSASQAIGVCEQLRTDVALFDSRVAAEREAVRDLVSSTPTKVVAFGVSDDEELLACAESGVSGFVPPEASLDVLVSTFDAAARGEMACGPRVAGQLLQHVAALAEKRDLPQTGRKLTARQAEIVRLIGDGLSNKGIAERLGIELPTVKNHVHNILEKLELSSRTEVAVRVAPRPGLAQPLSLPLRRSRT